MHMHAFKIRVMLRLCGSSFILFTIFAASTITSVAARHCNGYNENLDATNDNPINFRRDNQMPARPKTTKKTPPRPNDPSNNGTKTRNRCCPYDFDSNFCKIVDDRILCGYNRNAGRPKSKDTVMNLHGGCRLRGGRLECGYQHGPFTNPRRPPSWNNPPPNDSGNARPKA